MAIEGFDERASVRGVKKIDWVKQGDGEGAYEDSET